MAPSEGARGIPFPGHVPGTAIVDSQPPQGHGIRAQNEVDLGTSVHAITVVRYRTKRSDVLLSGTS